MPYAPGVRFDPSPIERGMAAVGDEFKQAMEKREQNAKEIDFLGGQVQAAAQFGALTPEDLAAFESGSLSRKREIGTKAGVLLKDRILQQQLDVQRQNSILDYKAAMARLAPDPQFDPSGGEVELPGGQKVPFVRTSRGGVQILKGGDDTEVVTPEMEAKAAAEGYAYLPKPEGGYTLRKKEDQYEVDAAPELVGAVESYQNYRQTAQDRKARIRQLENAAAEGQDMTKPTPGLSVEGVQTLGDELRMLKRFNHFEDEVQKRGQSPLGKWLQGGGPPMRKVRGDAPQGAAGPSAAAPAVQGEGKVLPDLPELPAQTGNPNEMVTVVDVTTGQTGKIKRAQVAAALNSGRYKIP